METLERIYTAVDCIELRSDAVRRETTKRDECKSAWTKVQRIPPFSSKSKRLNQIERHNPEFSLSVCSSMFPALEKNRNQQMKIKKLNEQKIAYVF